MSVDRRPLFAPADTGIGIRVADLSIDHVLPQQHAISLLTAGGVHPRRHLRHGAAIDHLGCVKFLDAVFDAGDRRPRLAGKEQQVEAEILGLDAFRNSHLGQVEGIGRRTVERLRFGHLHPRGGARRHAGGSGTEGKCFGL